MRRLTVAVLVAAAMTAGACGGGGGDSADAPATTLAGGATTTAGAAAASGKAGCEYLAKADVDAVMGTTSDPPKDQSSGSVGICDYNAAGPPFSGVSTRIEHGAASRYDKTVEALEEQFGKTTPLSGVGERAAWLFVTNSGQQIAQVLVAAKGSIVGVLIMAEEMTESTAKSQATALAQKIIDNL